MNEADIPRDAVADIATRPSTAVRPAVAAAPAVELPGVQILRGLAALAVVVHHVLEESAPLLGPAGLPDALVRFGACGVDVFFVVSGLIMLHTNWGAFGRPQAPGEFLRRRLARIVPLYWFCLGLVVLIHVSGLGYRQLDLNLGKLVGSALFVPVNGLVLGVAWTLVFEMYFYLLFALTLRARRPGAALWGVPIALACGAALAGALPFATLQKYLTDPIVLEFVFGLGLAWLLRNGRLPRLAPVPVAVLALVLLAGAAALTDSTSTAGVERGERWWVWGVPAALLVAASLPLREMRSPLARLLHGLGNASYALYLTHAIVMTAYARVIKDPTVADALPAAAWMSLALLASLTIGGATHRWVERPMTQWLRRRMRR